MARDSRRADPRRVVAVDSGCGGGGGGGGGATARRKLLLVLLTLLLAIVIPVAYAESQGEPLEFFSSSRVMLRSFRQCFLAR